MSLTAVSIRIARPAMVSAYGLQFQLCNVGVPNRSRATIPPATSAIDSIAGADRCTVVCLPRVFFPHHFAAALPATVKLLKPHIALQIIFTSHSAVFGATGLHRLHYRANMATSLCRLDRSRRATRCRISEQVEDWNSSSLHPCQRSNYGEVSSIPDPPFCPRLI